MFRLLKKNKKWTRELLTWIQEVIIFRELRNSEKPRSIYLSTFLKKDKFIFKLYKPLLSSSLCKLESVFAFIIYRPKNSSNANIYYSETLRYSSDSHTSPSDRYIIIYYRKQE